jgi:hypothetical protein
MKNNALIEKKEKIGIRHVDILKVEIKSNHTAR